GVFAWAGTERPTVPIEPFEVEHRLGHPAVTRLLHPQYAVHAFYGAAGPERTDQVRLDPVVGDLLGVFQRPLQGYGKDLGGQRIGRRGRMPQSPPTPYQDVPPFGARLGLRQPLMHPIQEGEAASIQKEVADLLPLRSPERAQTGRDLRLGSDPVVQLPIAMEHLQRGTVATPGRFESLDPLELPNGLGPSRAGRLTRAARINALALGVLKLGIAGLPHLPERLHAAPFLGQHAFGLLSRVEEIQAM